MLKIFHFVPLCVEPDKVDLSLLFRCANSFTRTFFVLLAEGESQFEDEEELFGYITTCINVLMDISKVPVGLPIVLRCLVEGAINSKFAMELFGGKCSTTIRQNDFDRSEINSKMNESVSLLEENYKFKSMPTHPLGTTTVFHAGLITVKRI